MTSIYQLFFENQLATCVWKLIDYFFPVSHLAVSFKPNTSINLILNPRRIGGHVFDKLERNKFSIFDRCFIILWFTNGICVSWFVSRLYFLVTVGRTVACVARAFCLIGVLCSKSTAAVSRWHLAQNLIACVIISIHILIAFSILTKYAEYIINSNN